MGSRNRAEPFINAAQSFLAAQNYEECRKQAILAQESDPHNVAPSQLIAIANVMSAFATTISSSTVGSSKKSDYYSVLGVPRFTEDLDAIEVSYDKLSALLNPRINPFHLCPQALALVRKAWRVLSDPIQKSKFDEELRLKLKSVNGSGKQTFWTVCTHCYYLYEYPAEYKNCFMKCQNLSCQSVFTASVCPPPHPEVIEKGRYDSLEGVQQETTKLKMAANCSNKLMGKGARVVHANGSAPL